MQSTMGLSWLTLQKWLSVFAFLQSSSLQLRSRLGDLNCISRRKPTSEYCDVDCVPVIISWPLIARTALFMNQFMNAASTSSKPNQLSAADTPACNVHVSAIRVEFSKVRMNIFYPVRYAWGSVLAMSLVNGSEGSPLHKNNKNSTYFCRCCELTGSS